MDHQVLPCPNFKHLKRLTDDTGILQHAKYHIPNRDHGYCVDDNVRALLVVTLARKIWPYRDELDSLASTYLSFILHAYNGECSRFRNFMSYDRRWLENEGSEDSHGRAVWSLGVYSAEEPVCLESSLAYELFAKSLEALEDISASRALAFSALGIDAYLASNHSQIQCLNIFKRIASTLKHRHKSNANENWPWLENEVTYDNARISQALILAGHRLEDQEMKSFGLDSLEWLMEIQTSDKQKYFQPVGCDGWFPKGGSIALLDQQPLEATAMIDACFSAFDISRDPKWNSYAKLVYDGFWAITPCNIRYMTLYRVAVKTVLDPMKLTKTKVRNQLCAGFSDTWRFSRQLLSSKRPSS